MESNEEKWLQSQIKQRQNELSDIGTCSNANSKANLFESMLSKRKNPNVQPEASGFTSKINNEIRTENPLNLIEDPMDELTVSEIDTELNSLLKSQTVSKVLNSYRFRKSLEKRLQSSLNKFSSDVSKKPENRQQPQETKTPAVNIQDIIDPRNDPELNALLSYQVVSNMLQSVFRTHLENTLWSRYIMRNQNDINTRPININNTSISEETEPIRTFNGIQQSSVLHSMKNEISEMRSMMRIMLQSQIETQRFIRQEMASIRSSVSRDSGIQNASELQNNCVICLNCLSDTMMYRCGHLCLCYPCSMTFRISAHGGQMFCPVCRIEVLEIIRVFTAAEN